MWDGLLVLILLCIVMAVASFLAGMLPLYFSLSSRQLRLISALGTGILVGTALIIIIPEGVETIYTASESTHPQGQRSISLVTRATTQFTDTFPASLKHDTWRRAAQADEVTALPIDIGLETDAPHRSEHYLQDASAAQALQYAKRQEGDDQQDENGEGNTDGTPDQEDDSASSSSTHDPHAYVGISLIAGFMLMYLIDTLPKHYRTSRSRPERFHISLNNLSFNHNRADSLNSLEETGGIPAQSNAHSSQNASPSTTTGLVIHACADGIALGASSTTTSRLTFIIFIALIVHKAPAAFGLTSVLLKQGLSKRSARAHLIVFALAAPVGALLTWLAAHLFGYSSSAVASSMSAEFFTGILLLFSGGTFLYVAVHTMQESAHEGHGAGEVGQMNGYGYRGVGMSDLYPSGVAASGATQAGMKGVGGGGSGRLADTLVTSLGMILPLLVNLGHGH